MNGCTIGKLLAGLSAAALLTGCWDRVEVNDMALVMGTGVDQLENGKLRLTIQIFVPQSMPSGGQSIEEGNVGGGNQGQTLVQTAEGVSLADAVARAQQKLSRRLNWGHDEVFIFGERRAAQGMEQDIDFLFRYREPREKANVYVAKGEAADKLLLVPLLERDSAEMLSEMSTMRNGLDITLFDTLRMFSDASKAAVLPVIELLPQQPDQTKMRNVPYPSGSAVLKDGKLVGKLDNRTTRGVLWLRNEIGDAVFTFKPEGASGTISLRLVKNRTRLVPHVRDGKWSVDLHIRSDTNLLQNASGGDVKDPRWIEKTERSAERDIQDRITSALKAAQDVYQADIFGFSHLFKRRYPKAWKQAKSNWDETFRQIQVNVYVHVHIKRPGVLDATVPY